MVFVQRPNTVKIKAQDENGAKVSLSLTDWQARIFQHEYDHLQVSLTLDQLIVLASFFAVTQLLTWFPVCVCD